MPKITPTQNDLRGEREKSKNLFTVLTGMTLGGGIFIFFSIPHCAGKANLGLPPFFVTAHSAGKYNFCLTAAGLTFLRDARDFNAVFAAAFLPTGATDWATLVFFFVFA